MHATIKTEILIHLGMKIGLHRITETKTVKDMDSKEREVMIVIWNEPDQGIRTAYFDIQTAEYVGGTI